MIVIFIFASYFVRGKFEIKIDIYNIFVNYAGHYSDITIVLSLVAVSKVVIDGVKEFLFIN